MSHRLYLYSKPIRFWHWLNAAFFLLLIVTGISMQYADPDSTLIPFRTAVTLHNIGAFGVVGCFIIYVLINRFTWNRKFYNFEKGDYSTNLKLQFQFYVRDIFKHKPAPFPVNENRKFNPLQKFTYVAVMYIGLPLLILTGIGLFFPSIILPKFLTINGILFTAVTHSAVGFLISLFMILHIYLCTIGTTYTSTFRSMITGYHES